LVARSAHRLDEIAGEIGGAAVRPTSPIQGKLQL